MNLNKVFLIGNLTRDPELKTLPSGTAVVNFGLATNRIWKDQSGVRQQDTQFHNIVMFGKQAEIAKQYLTKGAIAMIEGRIQTRSWQAADGNKRYTTEVVAERMQMGPRGARSSAPAEEAPQKPPKENLDTIEYPEESINPDDIPF